MGVCMWGRGDSLQMNLDEYNLIVQLLNQLGCETDEKVTTHLVEKVSEDGFEYEVEVIKDTFPPLWGAAIEKALNEGRLAVEEIPAKVVGGALLAYVVKDETTAVTRPLDDHDRGYLEHVARFFLTQTGIEVSS